MKILCSIHFKPEFHKEINKFTLGERRTNKKPLNEQQFTYHSEKAYKSFENTSSQSYMYIQLGFIKNFIGRNLIVTHFLFFNTQLFPFVTSA